MPILERELTDAETPKLRPLNDYVYVRQDRIPDKAGKFYLPDSTRKHKATRYGMVLAVGPGRLVCRDVKEEEKSAWYRTKLGMNFIEYTFAPDFNTMATYRLPLSVQPGDRVAFMDFAGSTVFAETDPSLLLMREEEILAVMNG